MPAKTQSSSLPVISSPARRAELRERLLFLAELLDTRWVTQRGADDSARPAFQVDVPTRELDATIKALRAAAETLDDPPPAEARRAATLRERPVQHELKTWPAFFEPVFRGTKTFEIRKNDRDYQPGDELWLREWDLGSGYSGRECWRLVTFVLGDEAACNLDSHLIKQGYVILAIAESKATRAAAETLGPPPAEKQPNPCQKCGAFLWDDPRPCWSCAREASSPVTNPAIQGEASAECSCGQRGSESRMFCHGGGRRCFCPCHLTAPPKETT